MVYDIIVILVECGWLIGKICVKIIDFERIRRSCIKRRIVFDVDWWRIDTNFKIHAGFTSDLWKKGNCLNWYKKRKVLTKP